MLEKNIRHVSMEPLFAERGINSTHLLFRVNKERFRNLYGEEKLISKYPFYYHFPIKIPILHDDPYFHGGTEIITEERCQAWTAPL